MKITGATFKFYKTITYEEEAPTPEKPADSAKEKKPKVAGENAEKNEEKKKASLKDAFCYDMIKTAIKTTISPHCKTFRDRRPCRYS